FFFSSRRRHTRWPRDWSSDVCSSDLAAGGLELRLDEHERLPAGRGERERRRQRLADADERHVARDELRGERKLLERPCVHALERSEERRVGKECRCRWWAYH